MEIIKELFAVDFPVFIITVFILISSVIFIYETIGRFSKIIGRPVKWVRYKERDHELLINTIEEVTELKRQHEESVSQSIKHDAAIKNDLQKLTEMFLDKQIDDMRYEILDFASALSNGRDFNKEQFDHILQIYQKYEKTLEENQMSNGQVRMSMEVIDDIYKEKLKNGFTSL